LLLDKEPSPCTEKDSFHYNVLATIFFNNILLAILKLGFLALVPLLDGAKETANTGVDFSFSCALG
jgi:hypothetical protein